jgi:hypothetical protein
VSVGEGRSGSSGLSRGSRGSGGSGCAFRSGRALERGFGGGMLSFPNCEAAMALPPPISRKRHSVEMTFAYVSLPDKRFIETPSWVDESY